MSKTKNIFYRAMHDEKYLEIVKDILFHNEVSKLREFSHHVDVSRYEHSVNVSYIGYLLAKKIGLDEKCFARAGILHDMFFYDWRTYKSGTRSIRKSHAFYHGTIALENAEKYFVLSNKEKEMIKKHMWPATIIPPRYIETYFIGFVDKYCAIYECIHSKVNLEKKALSNVVKY